MKTSKFLFLYHREGAYSTDECILESVYSNLHIKIYNLLEKPFKILIFSPKTMTHFANLEVSKQNDNKIKSNINDQAITY